MMTVALKTSLSVLPNNDYRTESELGQDAPAPELSFTELYWDKADSQSKSAELPLPEFNDLANKHSSFKTDQLSSFSFPDIQDSIPLENVRVAPEDGNLHQTDVSTELQSELTAEVRPDVKHTAESFGPLITPSPQDLDLLSKDIITPIKGEGLTGRLNASLTPEITNSAALLPHMESDTAEATFTKINNIIPQEINGQQSENLIKSTYINAANAETSFDLYPTSNESVKHVRDKVLVGGSPVSLAPEVTNSSTLQSPIKLNTAAALFTQIDSNPRQETHGYPAKDFTNLPHTPAVNAVALNIYPEATEANVSRSMPQENIAVPSNSPLRGEALKPNTMPELFTGASAGIDQNTKAAHIAANSTIDPRILENADLKFTTASVTTPTNVNTNQNDTAAKTLPFGFNIAPPSSEAANTKQTASAEVSLDKITQDIELIEPRHFNSAGDSGKSLFTAPSVVPMENINNINPSRTTQAVINSPVVQTAALQTVADNLIKAYVSQSSVSIRLDPPEMGNVLINFRFDTDGGVSAVIRSESAETSAFLRDKAEVLLQALKDSGFDSVDLSFEQNSQSHDDQNFLKENYKEAFFSVEDTVLEDLDFQQNTLVNYSSTGNQPVDMKL